jgi:hypothetical protein
LVIGVLGVIVGVSTVVQVVTSSTGIVIEVIAIVVLARIWLRKRRSRPG